MKSILLTLTLALLLFTSCKKEDEPKISGCGIIMGYDVNFSNYQSALLYYFDIKFHNTNKTERIQISVETYYNYYTGEEICF